MKMVRDFTFFTELRYFMTVYKQNYIFRILLCSNTNKKYKVNLIF